MKSYQIRIFIRHSEARIFDNIISAELLSPICVVATTPFYLSASLLCGRLTSYVLPLTYRRADRIDDKYMDTRRQLKRRHRQVKPPPKAVTEVSIGIKARTKAGVEVGIEVGKGVRSSRKCRNCGSTLSRFIAAV